MIYVASDHGGWKQKQALVKALRHRGHDVVDLGPARLDPADDYPVWAARTARLVQRAPKSFGILLCRTGVGMAIVANKFRGIRAAQAGSVTVARRSRQDENANVLSLAADELSTAEIQKIALAWLQAAWRPLPRYHRRLRQLAAIDHGR